MLPDRLRWVHLSRWKLPRHALHHSIRVDYWVGKILRKGGMRCSLRPWIQCTSVITESRITTWHSPGLQCANTIGKDTKILYIGVIWGLLRVKDCSFLERDHPFATRFLRRVSKRWWLWSQEKNCIAKLISLLLHRKELYWSWTCTMDARTLQALTRKRPSTILTSTKKIVTVERTRKLVAVKLTSGSKDCPFRLSKNTTSARKKRYKMTKKQNRAFNPLSEKSKEWSAAWKTWSTSRLARSLPNIQSSNCVTYWPKGIEDCTCGTCLKPSHKVRKLDSDRCDVLSIPFCVKKGPSRHGNTGRPRIYHQARVSSRKAKKEYKSIQDRFLRCPFDRQSQLNLGWTEELHSSHKWI